MTLRAANGMLGLIEAGYTHPDAGGTYEFRINAERGALVDTGSRLIAVPDRQPAGARLVAGPSHAAHFYQAVGRMRGRLHGRSAAPSAG